MNVPTSIEWESRGRRKSEMGCRKMIGILRREYSVDHEWHIIIIEALSNSVDANASIIEISAEPDDNTLTLSFHDNGDGMTIPQFIDYHKFWSDWKTEMNTGIGFVGMGSKLCMDILDEIYTETRSGEEPIASIFWLPEGDDEPDNEPAEIRGLVRHDTGTYIEMSGVRTSEYNESDITDLVRYAYRYSMPPYGDLAVYVGGTRIRNYTMLKVHPIKFDETIERPGTRMKPVNVTGEIFVAEHNYHEPGLSIVVEGKTVETGHFFGLEGSIKPLVIDKIHGYLRCDQLLDSVKLSKDSLKKKGDRMVTWKHFNKFAHDTLRTWLEDNDILLHTDRPQTKADVLVEDIDRRLNDIINKFPDLLEHIPMKSGPTREIPREGGNGQVIGISADVLFPIVHGGGRRGGGIKKKRVRRDGGSGAIIDGNGNMDIDTSEEPLDVMRTEIVHIEHRKEMVWFNESKYCFVVNSAHPAFVMASGKSKSALEYHILSNVINCMFRELVDIDRIRQTEIIWGIFKDFITKR